MIENPIDQEIRESLHRRNVPVNQDLLTDPKKIIPVEDDTVTKVDHEEPAYEQNYKESKETEQIMEEEDIMGKRDQITDKKEIPHFYDINLFAGTKPFWGYMEY